MKRNFLRIFASLVILSILLPSSSIQARQTTASTGAPAQEVVSDVDPTLPEGLTSSEWQSIQNQIMSNLSQQAYLKASNTDARDYFCQSVAVSNDIVVVGVTGEDSAATGVNGDQNDNSALWAGAVYVFVRDDTTWTQQSYLKASNTDANDHFGLSVAVSNDTIVVGANREASAATGVNGDQNDNSAEYAGAAYVFVRDGSTWTQQAYLKASNTDADDEFGVSVAVSNDTIVVGAYGEDSAATGVNGNQSDNSANDAGAAYVFVRDGTTWTQQAYLKASNTDAGDLLGRSVAVSNDTIVVGVTEEDSAATGVNGDQNDNSASGSGAAYVFVRDGTTWTQQAYLKASNTGWMDHFGYSVAISNDTIVVGANRERSAATGVNGDQNDNSAYDAGAAYAFVRSGTTWTQQAYLKASNTDAKDSFGVRVAISNETIVVGAPFESSAATGVNGDQNDNSALSSGAVYVFVRSGTIWTQQAYLKASNTDAGDWFGLSVAVTNDKIVVGAVIESSAATGVNGDQNDNSAWSAGAAYVFSGETSAPPVSITGIEINQALGVQKNNEENFVARKSAVVRVLLDHPIATNPSTQTLTVKRGSTQVAVLRPNNNPSQVNSIDFYLPPSLTDCDSCPYSQAYTFEANIDGKTMSRTVNFQLTYSIRILAVPLKVKYNGNIISLPDQQWKTAWKFLSAVYPVADDGIEWVVHHEELDFTSKDLYEWQQFGLLELLFQINTMGLKSCVNSMGQECFDYIVGFLPPIALCGSTACENTCGCMEGFTHMLLGNSTIVWANGSYTSSCTNQKREINDMRVTVAHEVGHKYGLGDEYNHPSATLRCEVNPSPAEYLGTFPWRMLNPFFDSCSSTDSCDDPSVIAWPGDTGTGSLISKDLNPFELRATLPNSYPRGLLANSISFMGSTSYVEDYWVTQNIYSHLFNKLKLSALLINDDIQSAGRVTSATGMIGLDDTVTLNSWYSYNSILPEPASGGYTISALNDEGTILASQGFDVGFYLHTNPPTSMDPGIFEVVVPFPEGTTKFIIMNGSTIISTKLVSTGSPSVRIVSPNGGETWSSDNFYDISWLGSDPDEDTLEYALMYSSDGIDWLPLATDLTDTTYTINPNNLPGGTQAIVKVIASDGINTVEDQSDGSFLVSGKSPVANIFYPNNNDVIPFGLSIILDGSGYDPEDEMIFGESVSWSSNVDGLLGNGSSVLVDLSYGYHTLTLEVVDSDGNTTQMSVYVFIGSKIFLPTVIR